MKSYLDINGGYRSSNSIIFSYHIEAGISVFSGTYIYVYIYVDGGLLLGLKKKLK